MKYIDNSNINKMKKKNFYLHERFKKRLGGHFF